jgi:hypothetical protein
MEFPLYILYFCGKQHKYQYTILRKSIIILSIYKIIASVDATHNITEGVFGFIVPKWLKHFIV